MKLHIHTFTFGLTFLVILLTGCSRCAQKTVDTPFETLQSDNRQSTSEHLRYDGKENGLGINMHTGDGLIVFEEYRSFVIQGVSKSTKPLQIIKKEMNNEKMD